LQKQDDLHGIRKLSGERRRYTEQMTHTASREIVDLAGAHAPAVIRLENFTDSRETSNESNHNWPYAMLQEQICYKATESGIPVQFVDPRSSSIRCRKCGSESDDNRDGNAFVCQSCNYEVHAGVNAAFNIATASVNE
jgi:IS605 OrfB family transposase